MNIQPEDLETKPDMPQFNIIAAQNPIHSFFGVKPLDMLESNRIEQLLVNNYEPSLLDEDKVTQHVNEIKNLTSEIKGINKQAILLIGERIFKANQILKNYKDGTFMEWVDSVFDSRKTAYNILAYYELHQSLPIQSKENLKKISPTAAYVIASRKIPLEKKISFVNEYHDLKSQDMMLLIKEMFPSKNQPTKTSLNLKLINVIQKSIQTLKERKEEINSDEKKLLESIIITLKSLLK